MEANHPRPVRCTRLPCLARVALASTALTALTVLTVLTVLPVLAQVVRLVTPNATLAEEFSAIRGVRELPDGRLLVSDYIDQRVVVVDLDRPAAEALPSAAIGPPLEIVAPRD